MKDSVPPENPPPSTASSPPRCYRLTVDPRGQPLDRHDVVGALRHLAGLGELEVCPRLEDVPTLETLDPMRGALRFDCRICSVQSDGALREAFIFCPNPWEVDIREQPHPGEGSSPPQASEEVGPRISAEKLGELAELSSQLVATQARLYQMIQALGLPELLATAQEAERQGQTLGQRTQALLRLPLASVFGRLRRLVRDLAASLGKSVTLDTRGGDTELDRQVLERLGDVLSHLLRNALDHGLETPEERQAAGKSATGNLRLEAWCDKEWLVVWLSDDGRGIDGQALLAQAIQRQVVEPDTELDEALLRRLLFAPGITTAATVTDVSGRGVGLDVVRQLVDELGGQIEVSSAPGQGTAFILRLPPG